MKKKRKKERERENAKIKNKKIEMNRVILNVLRVTPSRVNDAIIGEEEQKGKQRREKKERKRERVPNPATLDHSVTSYNVRGLYGEPLRSNPNRQHSRILYRWGSGEEERQKNTGT